MPKDPMHRGDLVKQNVYSFFAMVVALASPKSGLKGRTCAVAGLFWRHLLSPSTNPESSRAIALRPYPHLWGTGYQQNVFDDTNRPRYPKYH
jgi:hypothetical protein